MQFRGRSRAFLMRVGLAIVLLGAITATARDGRDFAGNYTLTNVQDQGSTMLLTLHVRLFNNSDADINGAVITLMQARTGTGLYGSFPTVKVWHKGQGITMSGQFTISKDEYKDWMRPPAQPNVVVIFQDATGQTWQRGVQLQHHPVL